MREGDLTELYRSGSNPYMALLNGFLESDEPITVDVDGEPSIMFGVVSQGPMSRRATIWMLGTDNIYKIKKTFIRGSAKAVEFMAEDYQYLFNYVDQDNRASIRWLNWLGFEFDEPAPYGEKGHLFMRFYKNV